MLIQVRISDSATAAVIPVYIMPMFLNNNVILELSVKTLYMSGETKLCIPRRVSAVKRGPINCAAIRATVVILRIKIKFSMR